MVFLYVTCKDMDEAKKIGKELIEQKVAGCVNIDPIHSLYRGNDGKVGIVEEVAMIIKTIDSKVQQAEDIVHKLHSYTVPCIASFALFRLNREYKEWLMEQVS